jgi:gliding motility-associated-like protein
MDSTANIPVIDPTNVGSGTYYIKAENNFGCISILPVVVTEYARPNASISGGGSVCKGESLTVTINLIGSAPFMVRFTDGDSIYTINPINNSSYSFTIRPDSSINYSLIMVQDAFCQNDSLNSTASITVNPVPAGIRYPTVYTTANTATPLSTRNIGGNTYEWNPKFGLNNYSIANPIFNYTSSVDYTIRLTTAQGCNVVDSQLVVLRDTTPSSTVKSGIWVPKAWSPNNSGKNDVLRPLCLNIREIKFFRVFNRWGQLVFETNQFGKGWDGIFRGKAQVSDVYTWTLEAYGVDGIRYFKSGNSILLR